MKNFYYDMLKMKLQFEQEQDNYNERNFLICKSCFWCASLLSNMHNFVNACPSCIDSELESMPLSTSEIYTFDYDSCKRSYIRILEQVMNNGPGRCIKAI